MILGKSIDKAQIKKIPIRAWSLTEEINATVKALREENQNIIPEDKLILIKAFYECTPISELNKKPQLKLVPGGQIQEAPNLGTIDEFEAAMLAADDAKKATQTPASATEVNAQPSSEAEPVLAAPVTDTTTPVVEAVSPEVAAPTDATAPIVEAAPVVAAPVSTEIPKVVEVVTNEIKNKPIKNYSIQDFLNLRKNGIRAYPNDEFITNGNCIIYDVNFDQILFFTEKPFKPGQEIVIEFCIHKTFTVTAKVLTIKNIGVGSRILSNQPVNYRINAILTHEHLGDKTLLRNFLGKVDPFLNSNLS